jgi:hypothetical protein
MKRALLTVTAAALLFAACGDDDTTNGPDPTAFVDDAEIAGPVPYGQAQHVDSWEVKVVGVEHAAKVEPLGGRTASITGEVVTVEATYQGAGSQQLLGPIHFEMVGASRVATSTNDECYRHEAQQDGYVQVFTGGTVTYPVCRVMDEPATELVANEVLFDLEPVASGG